MKFEKRVYAIQDSESGLFVTRPRLNYRLEELGTHTLFFEKASDAMRTIENTPSFEFRKDCNTVLQNDLAWDLLEKIHGKDRWHLNVLKAEFQDAVEQFKHLKVKEIILTYDE